MNKLEKLSEYAQKSKNYKFVYSGIVKKGYMWYNSLIVIMVGTLDKME